MSIDAQTLLQQTTPGPWVWRAKSVSLHQVGKPPYEFGPAVLEPSHEYDTGLDVEVSEPDAALVAAAPALAERVKALEEALAAERAETIAHRKMVEAETAMCRAQDREDPKVRVYEDRHTECCHLADEATVRADLARAALASPDPAAVEG